MCQHSPPHQVRIAGVVYELAAGEQLRITAQLGKDGTITVIRSVVEPQAMGAAGVSSGATGAAPAGQRARKENECL